MDINSMMDILLANLVEELADTGKFCAQTLYPGDSVPYDYGDCGGIAWVRLTSAAPSATFPVPVASMDVCAYALAFELEVGVMRPIPTVQVVGGRATLPTDSQNIDATHRQVDDAKAAYRAIERLRQYTDFLLIGSYTPQGGSSAEVVGGMWTVSVGEDDDAGS